MQKSNKIERMELYRDRNTQAFLNKFLSGEISELEPVYDSKLGYSYPMVETILGDASEVEPFLNRLFEVGILKKRLYDKVIYCPKCDSANISIHYCCPYCKSFNIQRSALIEHVKCGYMDVEENFKKGNKLVCPKCHEELKKSEVDYRKAGTWCTCKDCNKSFDIPLTAHFCRNCHTNFTFEEAVIKDVYAYSLNEEVKEEAALGWVIISPIREFLIENGFEVESPAFVKGKSGANHMFDIATYLKGEAHKITVIDIATSTENAVSEQPIIALFAKVFDVSPESAYLIAIPKVSENGKKMAELYNIKVIEAKNQKEAIKALKEKML
ncbi:MAG: TackOD1 domain-containing metal-binding protein [Candidatus Bathycorpusculaceae bacterium]